VNLKNPARRARIVFISGTVTLYAPGNRPTERIVIKKYRDHAGKALDHPELQRRGIQMTVTASEKTPPQQAPRPGKAYSSQPLAPCVPAVNGAVPMTVLPDASPSSLVPLPRDNPPALASGNANSSHLAPVADSGTLGGAFAGAFTKMLSFGAYDLSVEIVDPKDQIYGLQLFNEAGKLVAFNGWSCSSGASATFPLSIDGSMPPDAAVVTEKIRCEFAVRGGLPKDGYLVLHLSTDDNLRKIPFSATVVLP